MADFGEQRTVTLCGGQIAYRQYGDRGPVVVLLHGVADSGHTWDTALSHLAPDGDHHGLIIIVPDLLGHGLSAKPRTDYSLGAHANMLRDLLDELGHDHVTLVGHSLGGGVAMQFAYQFPARCDALMLVASGGLGGEVSAVLRAAALPGSALVMGLLTARQVRGTIGAVAGALARTLMPLPLPAVVDIDEVLRVYAALDSSTARTGFLATLRSVVDPLGQRVSAVNWLPAAAQVPTILVWGSLDRIIPVQHAHRAHELISGSRLVIFPGAGHFPHRYDPTRFATLVLDFVQGLRPAIPRSVSTVPALVTSLHERRVSGDRRVTRDQGVTRSASAPPTSQAHYAG